MLVQSLNQVVILNTDSVKRGQTITINQDKISG